MKTPVVDAHLHIWDLERFTYPWLDSVPDIKTTYLIEDYDRASESIPVEKMVFIQCECLPEQYLDELSWVQSVADKDARLAGIVPWAPLEQGEAVSPMLEQMTKDSRVKGIRRILQGEPVDFCLQPDFVQGVQLLGHYGLHFELCIDPTQFPNVLRLIDRCPDTRFVLDHIGNPDISRQQIESWASDLRAFKDSGDHFCKFSNLVCNADLNHWTLDDLKPYADAVMDTFTPERVIWASDWPHVLRASSFARWIDAAQALTSHLTDEERTQIFHDNAINFYRL